jgi:Uma2 family endonuclease
MDMTAELVIQVPADGVWTWDDLQTIPDEAHHHYELIEGQILRSPSPDLRHQDCVFNLAIALRSTSPRDLKVVVSPFDFVPEPGTALQPDVLVIRRGTAEEKRTVAPPVLAVEVLSPSSRTTDRVLKRQLYARFGVEHYWIVDPAVPSIVALRLSGDEYVEVGGSEGALEFVAAEPFEVRITPAALIES